MPDAHLGKGATVGSVIPTLHHIMPAAIGVDPGCGMCAVKTQFTYPFIQACGKSLTDLRIAIEKSIPTSLGSYGSYIDPFYVTELEEMEGVEDADMVAPNWRKQVKSLGTGNHFIELSTDEWGMVWIFLHSGSRGVGNKLASMHIKIAQDICRDKRIDLPNRDLAYLDEADASFWDYITDLRWAQRFAYLNRQAMMAEVKSQFENWIGIPIVEQKEINCHHNYTVQEQHFGKTVWVSRKGAIDASYGTYGLIPGSMSDASFVVMGKGNEMALDSAPHGAGRPFSRAEARRRFSMADLEKSMQGIEWRHSDKLRDEMSGAYKPIKTVMEDAADLVQPVHELHQFLNVKGD